MATKPTPGGSDGTYGTEMNAFLDVSLASDGKIIDGAVFSTSAAPTVDAGVTNKKHVDDQITANVPLSAESNTDSTSDVMVKNQSYLAQSDGVVRVQFTSAASGNALQIFVHTAADAKESGRVTQFAVSTAIGQAIGVACEVKNGEFFEIVVTPTAAIQWTSRGTQAKPVDQD